MYMLSYKNTHQRKVPLSHKIAAFFKKALPHSAK